MSEQMHEIFSDDPAVGTKDRKGKKGEPHLQDEEEPSAASPHPPVLKDDDDGSDSHFEFTLSSHDDSTSRDDRLYKLVKGEKWSKLHGFLDSGKEHPSPQSIRNSISYKDNYARSPLHYACIRGAGKDVIVELLEVGGAKLLMTKDLLGRTALHDACFHGTTADVSVVESLLERGGVKLLMAKNNKGRTALHEAVRYGTTANSNLVECLLSYGGKKLVMTKDDAAIGRTVLHYACKCGVSVNVLKSLVKYGGMDLVTMRDRSGQTALHYAYIYGASRNIIRFLLNVLYKDEFGEGPCNALANALGKNESVDDEVDLSEYSNPIDYFLDTKPIDHNALLRIQSIWYDLDPLAASATSESFSTTLQNVEALKYIEDRDNILEGPFVKTALNHSIVQVPSLFILFLDLLLQAALIVALSFFVTSNEVMPSLVSNILVGFVVWISIREFTQMYFAKTLYAYVLHQSNWVDLAQIVVVILLLAWGSENVDERLLITSIGVSWLRLVIVSGNLVYSVAVFVKAVVRILASLIPFLYVTSIIVIAFAHMFFAVGPPSGEAIDPRCLGVGDNIDTRWNCGLRASYFQSFSMFLTGNIDFLEEPDGMHSVLAAIFGFIMGILLLNIIIAIISNVFSEIQQNSEKAFWANRLKFVNEIDNMKDVFLPRILSCWCQRRRKAVVPARRAFVEKDIRGYNNWRVHNYYAPFIEWFVDGEDNDHFVSRWHCLYFFVRVAEWKEIIPPSAAFRKALMMKRQHEVLTFGERCISWFASFFFIVLFTVLVPIGLVLGFITCGYFWPRELKREMFFVDVKNIQDEEGEILQLRSELEQVRRSHVEETKQLKDYLKKTNEAEVDRLEKRLDEILGLLHSMKK